MRVLVLLLGLIVFGATGARAHETGCPAPLVEMHLIASADGTIQPVCGDLAPDAEGLVVNLHSWSGDHYWVDLEIAEYAAQIGFNYIVPSARGRNDHPDSCGSDLVVKDIDDAITAFRTDGPVVIVGHSGGGFDALNHLVRGEVAADFYSAWVPIVDLEAWYHETVNRELRYAEEIAACTGLIPEEMAYRSPITHVGASHPPVHISAGILDGHAGNQVPISHSIRFYNAAAAAAGREPIPADIVLDLLSLNVPRAPEGTQGFVPLFEHGDDTLGLTIFDGGHQIVSSQAVQQISEFLGE